MSLTDGELKAVAAYQADQTPDTVVTEPPRRKRRAKLRYSWRGYRMVAKLHNEAQARFDALSPEERAAQWAEVRRRQKVEGRAMARKLWLEG